MKIIYHKDGTKTIIDKIPNLGKDRFNDMDRRINKVKEITERVQQKVDERK